MGWSGRVNKAAYVSLVVTIVGGIGPCPPYNVVFPFVALVATANQQGKQVLALVIGLFLSIVTDIIWMLFNHGDLAGLLYFSLVCISINILVKAFMLFCASQLFIDMGGTFSLMNPGVPIDRSSRDGSFTRTPGSFSSDFTNGAPNRNDAPGPSFPSYQHGGPQASL